MKQAVSFLLLLGVAGSLQAAAQTDLAASDRLRFADGLYVRGLYDLAAKEYLALIRDEPPGVPLDTVLFRIGECNRHLGRREMAERYYKRLVNDYPDSPHRALAGFRRAELYVSSGQYLDAVNLLRALLETRPPDDVAASVHYYLGWCLDKLRLRNEAEGHLKTVIERFPESPFFTYACLALAELYGREGKPASDVRALYRQAAERPTTARSGAEALFQWAEHAFRAGDYAESADAYEALLRRYPEDERLPEARLQIAWAFLKAGRYEATRKLAEEQLAAGDDREDEEEWLYLQANSLRQMQKFAQALAAYDRLLTQYPAGRRRVAAAYEKALMAFRRGRYDEVLAGLAGLEPTPDIEQDFFWLLAESHAARGHREEALADFRKLVERWPNSERAPQALYRQAELEQAGGDLVAAAQTFRGVAEQFPQHDLAPDALFSAGYCRGRIGQHEEALKDWSELVEKYPEYSRADVALYQVAAAQIQLARPEDAHRTLEDLLEKFPQTDRAGDALEALGLLHEQAGRLEQAEAALREALGRQSDKAARPRIQFRLATVMQKQGRENEAAALIQSLLATAVRKDMPPALLEWLADFQFRQGAPKEALGAARVLVEQADTPAWKQIGWYWVGRAQQALGRAQEAGEAYEKALQQDARTAEAAESALKLGELKLGIGDAVGAAFAFQQAAERSAEPELMSVRARSYFGLARTAAAQKQWEEAARFYMSVAVLFDDPELAPQSLYEAATLYDRIGRAGESRQAREELRKRYPESPWARQARLGTGEVGSE